MMKPGFKPLALGALLLSLTACMSAEERTALAAAQLEADRKECASIGFTPETEAFGNCILKLREIRAKYAEAAAIDRAATAEMFNDDWPYWGRRYPYWW